MSIIDIKMAGERLVKGAVFLALMVLTTGCRHKDEPLRPLVIVDKPAKEDVQILVNMSDASGQPGSWKYMLVSKVIWKRCCLWKERK